MINILTLDYSAARGPAKVVRNLLKGFDRIGYPYVINRRLDATQRCYIPNRRSMLRGIGRFSARCILGPNLYVLPHEIPASVDLSRTLYVQPSQWVVDLWVRLGVSSQVVRPWAAGIDTDAFRPSGREKKYVTVYHKQRAPEELAQILRVMDEMKLPHRTITYGSYDEMSYRKILEETSFLVWHGCQESQGMALQEALSCDVPVLVCDATSFSQSLDGYPWPDELLRFPVTSAPYFDARCGIKLTDLRQLGPAIQRMHDGLGEFRPREFILQNLSLAKQAREFVALYVDLGLSVESGYHETLATDAPPPFGRLLDLRESIEGGVRRLLQRHPRSRPA